MRKIVSVLEQNKIDTHYQPIFSLKSNNITGYESLSRFNTTPYKLPNIWFEETSRVNLGEELEMMAIKNAIRNIEELKSDIYIAIHTFPGYVLSGAIGGY